MFICFLWNCNEGNWERIKLDKASIGYVRSG